MEPHPRIREYRGYTLMVDDTQEHPWFEAWFSGGTTVIPQVSRFHFNWTQERFEWLIDHAFPTAPIVHTAMGDVQVPWSNISIDIAMGMYDAKTA